MATLVLDDEGTRRAWFKSRIPTAVCVATSAEAIAALTATAQRGEKFSTLFCDRHLGDRRKNGIGDDVIDHIVTNAEYYAGLHVVLHTSDAAGAHYLVRLLDQKGISASACPFGSALLEEAIKGVNSRVRAKV
jgi:hypothetical protein